MEKCVPLFLTVGRASSGGGAGQPFGLPFFSTRNAGGVSYAIRLPANDVLERAIEDLLTRPRGPTESCPVGPLSQIPA